MKSHHRMNPEVWDAIEGAFSDREEKFHWFSFAAALFLLYQIDASAIGHLRGSMEDQLIEALGWAEATDVHLFLNKGVVHEQA